MKRLRRWSQIAAVCTVLLLQGVGAITGPTATTSTLSGTSVIVGKPAGVLTHDVLIAQVSTVGGDGTVTATGWTSVSSAGAGGIFQAILRRTVTDASSEASTYTFSAATAGAATGIILRYSGVDTASPVGTAVSNTGTGSTLSATGLTTARDQTRLVSAFTQQNDGAKFTYTATKQAEASHKAGPAKLHSEAGDETVAAAGSAVTRTASSSKSDEWVVHLVALNPPTVAFATGSQSVNQVEDDATVTLTVSLSAPVSLPVTVNWATSGGSATPGSDFTSSSGTLTFAAGETTKAILVDVKEDSTAEFSETFNVTLSSPANAALGSASAAQVTILDDDPHFAIDADPVDASGAPLAGARWGGWTAEPGAPTATSTNWLRITNLGPSASEQVTLDFTPTVFTGATDPTETIPLEAKIVFASWEAPPGTTSPSGGTFAFSAPPSATGSTTLTFSGVGNVYFVTYQVLSLPSPLVDQSYQATYTAT